MPSMNETNAALDRFVRSQMKALGVPGVSVGILKGGRRYVNGYGVTNVDHALPVDAGTYFQIGSTTKTYTASAIMRLVEQGKLDLNAKVRRYLPEFKMRSKDVENNATILHLLTHTGGWIGDYFEDTGRGEDALAKMVAKMAKLKQLTPLGQVWSYNNSGFYVAGRIIEKVTKKSYEEAVRELLLEPLGMEHSFFFADEVIHNRVAVGHVTQGKKTTVATPWALRRAPSPAGAIISTAGDQLMWAAFHMGDGRAASGKRVLRKSTLKLMQRPHAPAGSMADFVGISWLLRTVDGHKLVAHGGTTNGQLSAFLMVPDRSFAVTVLTNSTTGGQLHREVVNWSLEHYLGITRPAPTPIKLSSDALRAYTGMYRQESTGTNFEVSARNGGLVATLPTAPPDPSRKKEPPPMKIPLQFVAADRVMSTTGYFKGTLGEFLRGPKGNVTWLRLGGRIQRRVGP